MWLEGILNKKYPNWRSVEHNDDGTARYMPAGARRARSLAAAPLFGRRHRLLLPGRPATSSSDRDTRVVAVSTHNPLGVTFAAGVYTSIFGSAKQPINSHYARELFATIKSNPYRGIVQGHRRRLGRLADQPDQRLRRAQRRLRRRGAQRIRGDAGRCSHKAIQGEALPRQIDVCTRRIATASSSPTSARRSASSR